MWGLLYINVRDRQPQGIVEPGEEYERFREDLIERFLAVIDPETGKKVFRDVIKPETIYGPSSTPWDCPDLLLVPQEGVAVHKRIRSSWTIKQVNPIRAGGTHLLKGLWMACGGQIKNDVEFEANIHDLAPTVLTLMGLKVPDDMDGKAMTGIFQKEPKIRFSKTECSEKTQRESSTYSPQEEDQITQRLADLGYID